MTFYRYYTKMVYFTLQYAAHKFGFGSKSFNIYFISHQIGYIIWQNIFLLPWHSKFGLKRWIHNNFFLENVNWNKKDVKFILFEPLIDIDLLSQWAIYTFHVAIKKKPSVVGMWVYQWTMTNIPMKRPIFYILTFTIWHFFNTWLHNIGQSFNIRTMHSNENGLILWGK